MSRLNIIEGYKIYQFKLFLIRNKYIFMSKKECIKQPPFDVK